MLGGGTLTDDQPLPDEWRTYRLVQLTGWTPDEIAAADAPLCDWLLLFENAEADVRDAKSKPAGRGSSSATGGGM